MLSPWYLHQSLDSFSFNPERGLLATKIDRQSSNYMIAYRSDPTATFFDAFTVNWFDLKFFGFLPIVIISKVLYKIKQGKAGVFLLVLYWSNQVWYPVTLKILISVPILQVTCATTTATRPEPSHVAKDGYESITLIRFIRKTSTLSDKAVEIISASWR